MSKKPFKKPSFSGGPKALLAGIFIMVVLLFALSQLTDYARNMSDFTYKQFLDKVRADEVKSVVINGQQVEGILKDDKKFQATVAQRDADFDLLEKHGVDYSIATPNVASNFWYIMLLILILTLLGLASAWYINRQGKNNNGQGGGGLFNMGKSRAKIFMPNTIKEKFSSVAGAHEAKEELMDVVDFLKNPGKYRKIGAQITRGVLLQGEPGTGKTLLARAVAGEAQCPFISVSGSDFVEVFVGVGASRVRDLFAQAKRNAPCIVFIDEIDAVGRQRSGGGNGGSDEREQTLNQLLTEMDGFEINEEPIIVMAATNRADVLDKALLRPGRFDRIITVPVPDLISREEILNVHLKKVKIAPDVNVKKLARATIGYTGADLANFINTAAILATKAGLEKITMAQFEEARDVKMMGSHVKTLIMNDEEKKITAYHEGGHTLINILMSDLTHPLHKVTITPRSGGSLGVTCMLPEREKHLKTKEEFLADIRVSMGGRAAEMLACNVMTAGAGSDFHGASRLAYNMITRMGMSQVLGMAIYDSSYMSDETRTKVDIEIAKVLEEEYQKAYQMLVDNRDKLDIIAQLLLEKEVLEAEEIYTALGMQAPEVTKLV
ncbi:MAG: ATP-dependent zinc metalloprotease FtsH [Candidatus Dependentiae bacterium]|nr:ATP-dependent zinc metalloprotease FtsH [Candidatus Dependentiae bacterium]